MFIHEYEKVKMEILGSLTILMETADYIVVDKPAGWIVEQNPFKAQSVEAVLIKYLAQKKKNPFVGIVHRLDKVTSGVMIVAKKKSVLKLLNQQFATRQIKKEYLAIVENRPALVEAELVHWLEKDQKNKQAILYNTPKKETTQCHLTYKILNSKDELTLLQIQPSTGKFHQIRAQLSSIACPILGDIKYGSTKKYEENGIALHAFSLEFNDIEQQNIQKVTVNPPKNKWWDLLRSK